MLWLISNLIINFISKRLLQNISDEKFMQLFEALEVNTQLESLSLTNVGLTDKTATRLAEGIEKNSTLRVLKWESKSNIFRIFIY